MADKEGGETTPIRRGRSEVDENHYRLLEDPRSSAVFEKLRKRGWDAVDIEILIREIARIPEKWRYENEPLPEATKRRARLAKALRRLAKIIAIDRDLGGFYFEIVQPSFCIPEKVPPDALTLAKLLEIGANQIAPATARPDEPISPVEASRLRALRRYHPDRRPLLKSYAINKIFEKLKPEFKRAPNKEAEILAGILLKKPIKPGATTRLRKKTRRKY